MMLREWTGRDRLSTVVLGLGLLLVLRGEATAKPVADNLYQEGVVRFTTGDLKGSLRALSQAKKLTKDPRLLGRIYLYIGLNHAVLNRPAQAKEAFRTALTHNLTLSLDEKRFRGSIVEMFKEVRQLFRGELVITADRGNAEVLVDGKPVGKAPYKGQHPIGAHQVEVRTRDGKFGWKGEVVVALGKQTEVPATLTRIKAPVEPQPEPGDGTPEVESKPEIRAAIVAVFDIQDRMGQHRPEALQQLTDYLGGKIAEGGMFQVVPSSQVRQRLVEQKKESYKGCFDQQCQIEIGRELAAQKTLATQILKVGSTCAVVSTMYDLKRATTESSASDKCGCGQDELVSGLEKVVAAIKGQVAIQLPPVEGGTSGGRGGLVVDSKPPGAEVWIDGERLGATPLRVPGLAAGKHFLELRKGDYRHARKVAVVAGRFTSLSASLDKVVGRLEVRSSPPEAELLLDGRAVGKTPRVLADVQAGSHMVEVRKPGFAPARKEIHVGAGPGRQSVSLTLQRMGVLAVRSQPFGATILVDGRKAGQTPAEIEVAPGVHRVKLEIKGHEPAVEQVDARGGKVTVLAIDLRQAGDPEAQIAKKDEAPAGRRLWTWVAAGAAVAAAGAAIGLTASALSDHDEYETTDDPKRFDELEESIPKRLRVANAMWGVAAGLAVTSVVLFFVEGRRGSSGKKEQPSEVAGGKVRLMLMVGQTSGAMLSTSF